MWWGEGFMGEGKGLMTASWDVACKLDIMPLEFTATLVIMCVSELVFENCHVKGKIMVLDSTVFLWCMWY